MGESRIRQLEGGVATKISGAAKQGAKFDKYEAKSEVVEYKAAADVTIPKKRSIDESDVEEKSEKKKKKKDKEATEDADTTADSTMDTSVVEESGEKKKKKRKRKITSRNSSTCSLS